MSINRPIFALVGSILSIFVCLCWGDIATETVYLTWQRQPSTTMTVQWISPAAQTQTEVSYRPTDPPEPMTHQVGDVFPFPRAPQYALHRIELRHLRPGTEYAFKVEPYDETFHFRTPPDTLEGHEINFVVGGDMYHDALSIMEKTSRQAAKTAPFFALIGGDIAYAVGSANVPIERIERWVEWVRSWHRTMVTPQGHLIPVLAAIGNHDLIGHYDQPPRRAEVFSALFPMPGPQIFQVLDFNAYLTILFLDSGHVHSIAEQTAWIEQTLRGRRGMLHRLALYHVPAYPSVRSYNGSHGRAIRRFWVPLFQQGGIQTVFEHHDHAYKRTYPLLDSRRDPSGILYVGDGAWGVEHPRIPLSRKRRPYLAKFLSTRHFISVTLSSTQQQFQVIDDTGRLLDSFARPVMSRPGPTL